MTKLPATERFFAPEISKVYLALALVNPASLTRSEITASTDVTDEIADLSGWNVSSGMISVPDLGSRFTKQIGGRTSVDASSITFYGDLGGDDIRKVLARGDRAHLIFCDQGDAAGLPADVYPVQVTTVGKLRSVGDEAFRLTVGFAITGVPFEDVVLPAAA